MRTIKRDIVGGFIFSKDGKLLLGKSHKGGVYKGCWIVPGGGVEQNETHVEAIKRELLEETGIDISNEKIEKMKGSFTGKSEKSLRESGEKVLVDMRFYNFRITLNENANKIKLKTDDDFIEAEWFNIDDLGDLKLSPPTITSLQKFGIEIQI
jgi:8-oxo-dGTP pyrophosphatase MutT (NUDIX family)